VPRSPGPPGRGFVLPASAVRPPKPPARCRMPAAGKVALTPLVPIAGPGRSHSAGQAGLCAAAAVGV